MTIVEFLLARIAEDETAARDMGADAMFGAHWKHYPEDAYVELQSLVLDRSRRMLAECAAKRRIVEEYAKESWVLDQGHRTEWTEGGQAARETAIRILASVYADHPDFDPAWRP